MCEGTVCAHGHSFCFRLPVSLVQRAAAVLHLHLSLFPLQPDRPIALLLSARILLAFDTDSDYKVHCIFFATTPPTKPLSPSGLMIIGLVLLPAKVIIFVSLLTLRSLLRCLPFGILNRMTGLFDAILGVWTKSESRPAALVPEKRQEVSRICCYLSLVSDSPKTMDQVDAEDGPAVNPTCSPAATTGHADAAIPHDISSLSLEPEDVLPVIMSPIRSNNTSSSFTISTMDTSASLSTPGVDISFGPQTVPFAVRRRLPLHEVNSPSRVPFNSPQSMLGQHPRSVAITIRHPDDSIEETSEVIENGSPATAWRLDQIKYMRKARMSRDDTVRPIPTLNGPLSLPYARNPR